MNKIPTAEEFLFQQDCIQNVEDFFNDVQPIDLIEFAKLHVKAALEAAANNVYGEGHQLIDGKVVPLEKSDGIIFHPADQPYPDLEFIINPDSILNAYPENFIV